MKHNRIFALILMMSTLWPLWAQSDIFFSLKSAEPTSQVPQEVTDALNTRVRQILNRNGAAAADMYNVFAIEPILTITDIKKTSGLVQNVTLATGELTLIAINTADQAEYYSKTVELSTEVTGGDKTNALLKLVNSIKITDAQYTRFIRVARTKIAEYYTSHCDYIIQKAQALAAAGTYCEAINYLSAVPQVAPCWGNAIELIHEYAENCKAEKPAVDPTASDDPQIDAVPEPDPTPVPVAETIAEPIADPIAEPVKEPMPQPASNPQITISTKDFDFKVISCVGELSHKMITITVRIENLTSKDSSPYCTFLHAYTDDGRQLKDLEFDGGYHPSLPAKVWLKKHYIVKNVTEKFNAFSYLKMDIGNTVVEIRDLKIDWQ